MHGQTFDTTWPLMLSGAAAYLHQAGPVQQVKVQHNVNRKGFGFITYGDLVR
jgi:hypothetical protein